MGLCIQVATIMEPQMHPYLFIRFLGTYHGTAHGGMAAMYSEFNERKAAGTMPPVPQTQQQPKQGGPWAKAEAAMRTAMMAFEELCAGLSDNDPRWGLLEMLTKKLAQDIRRIVEMQLPSPAAPPASNTGGTMATIQLAEDDGGRYEAAGNQPLRREPPERPQPSGVEPGPGVQDQMRQSPQEVAAAGQTPKRKRGAGSVAASRAG